MDIEVTPSEPPSPGSKAQTEQCDPTSCITRSRNRRNREIQKLLRDFCHEQGRWEQSSLLTGVFAVGHPSASVSGGVSPAEPTPGSESSAAASTQWNININ